MNLPTRFVARPSIFRLLLLLAGSVGFVVLGVWIAGLLGQAPRPGREWIGWVSILFFGLCTAGAVRRLFDRDDQIIADSRGLYWKQWSTDLIPWSQIADVRESSVRRQRFLSIHLCDPARYPSMSLLGKLGVSSKAMGFGDITITATGTDQSFDALKNAVLAHWSAGRP